MINRLFRVVLVAVLSISLLLVLFWGFLIADTNTRTIGFDDVNPVIYQYQQDDHTVVGFMGYELSIDKSVNTAIDILKTVNKNSAPLAAKVGTVLKDVIRMIIDRFVQIDGQ